MSCLNSLCDILIEGADQRLAAVDTPLTREALVDNALRFAATLQARGTTTLAVHLDDAAELATVLLGAWRAGVAVVMPGELQSESRARLRQHTDAVFSDDDEDEKLADWIGGTPLQPARLDLDTARLTLSTSGSTGEPKRIDKTLRQLDNEVQALERQWGDVLGHAVLVASVSAQHIYGLLFRVLWPLTAGRAFVRLAQPYPEYLQQASLSHAASGFAWITSPALLKRLGDNLDWDALKRVRQVFSSGGALPTDAAQTVRRLLGHTVTEIYGSSETGGIGWRQGGDAWTPFPGVRFTELPGGRAAIASPYLPLNTLEPCADAIEQGPDGRFTLLGRLDRIIKLEEKRISLPALEAALSLHPWVSEARLGVVQTGSAAPDDKDRAAIGRAAIGRVAVGRAAIGALVALSEEGVDALRNQGRRILTNTLRHHLAGYCDAIALPRRWRLLWQLPSNGQGKLPQARIEAMLAAERTRQPIRVSQTRQDDEWRLVLDVPLDLAHFAGHFPTAPVLPGVVQVDWALSLARELMTLPPRFGGMEVLKFQQLVRPGDRIGLTLRFDAERGKLYFAYHHADAPCASGRILLSNADA